MPEQVSRIDVKTGFRCNNRCGFCVQGDKRERHADKSTEDVLALLERGRQDADEVVLTGGEVTIRDDLLRVIGHAKELAYRVIQVQTNGRMLSSPRFVEALVDAGATEVSPAIHGPNAEVHDALTRVPGSFRQTVRGVRNAKSADLPVITNSVITRQNYQHLRQMAELFVALGVDQFQLAFVHPLGTAADNFAEVVPRLEAIQPYVLQALTTGMQAGVRCMTEAIPLCFLPGVEHLAAEWIIPRTKIFDATWTIDDYTDFRIAQGKAKGPPCGACARKRVCEGPWREYPERFGWAEFVPIPRATARENARGET